REIADRTALNKTAISSTMNRLFEHDLVKQADNVYYVDPNQANELKRRLKSLDSLIQLFESAPDDSYAEDGWERELPNLDSDGRTNPPEQNSETEETQIESLIAGIENGRLEE
ncbi:MarR family transcriptional regulator, partial [Halorubrum persicum]